MSATKTNACCRGEGKGDAPNNGYYGRGRDGTLPKALQEKGRQLVSRLKTTQWNDRGELLHEGGGRTRQ